MQNIKLFAAVFSAAILISACGSGDTNSSNQDPESSVGDSSNAIPSNDNDNLNPPDLGNPDIGNNDPDTSEPDDGDSENDDPQTSPLFSGITHNLPFDPAPRSALTASSKKVFAHYFTPYPLSINNKDPDQEYYRVHYLDPHGENGKFLDKGGLLRQKPLDRAPVPNYESFKYTDMRHEVRMAGKMGIDGFAVDILSNTGTQWERTLMMLDIAAEEFDDFYVLIMPDMNSLSNPGSYFVDMIKTLSEKPAAYRLDDGRLVIAPYLAENFSPQWWSAQVQNLKAEGIDVVLWPVYQGWQADMGNAIAATPNYQDIYYGVSDWGPRSPTSAANMDSHIDAANELGLRWMAPVAPQDMRPKSSIYTEAGGSETLRYLWMSAIEGGADWVQLITWNDYSEATEISPSTNTGYGFYDLSAYYNQWFKLGQPTIERDAMYAFYREHHTATPLSAQTTQMTLMQPVNNEAPRNEIELVAFLTEPGTLEIEIDGYVHRQHGDAGLRVYRVPTAEGTPIFRITRGGEIIQTMNGPVQITSSIDRQNMLYHAASSLRSRTSSVALSWPWRFGEYNSNQSLEISEQSSPFPRLSNHPAMRYHDSNANSEKGFGYSFLDTGANNITLSFDFNIQADSFGYFGYELWLADAKEAPGAIIDFSGGAQSGTHIQNYANGSYSSITNSKLQNDHWYRAEITVNGIQSGASTYQIRVYDETKELASASNVAFDENLSELSRLIFHCKQNDQAATSLLVDNLSLSVH